MSTQHFSDLGIVSATVVRRKNSRSRNSKCSVLEARLALDNAAYGLLCSWLRR